jgi:rhomboid protease GluP
MSRRIFYDDFPVTSILILLCGAFFGLEVYYTQRQDLNDDIFRSFWLLNSDVLTYLGSISLPRLRDGQVWRLISSQFLHGSILHILFNLWVLVDLGRICEPLLGRERFTVAYIISGIGAGLASVGFSAVMGHVHPSVGASGAVLGLIGLLFAFSLRHRDREMRDQIIRWVIYIAVFTYLASGRGPIGNIDHAAHVGGFLVGGVFGFFTPRYVTSGSARFWKIPFWIVVLGTVASLGAALWSLFSWNLG